MLLNDIHNLTLRWSPTFNSIPPRVLHPVVQRHAHSDKNTKGIEGDVERDSLYVAWFFGVWEGERGEN